jgi:YbbR domain-containing protein
VTQNGKPNLNSLNNLFKNPKILFLSIFFAVILWIYLNLSYTYSIEMEVPLELTYSKSEAVADQLPSNLDVTVNGRGWDLLNIIMFKKLQYKLDLSKYKQESKIITNQSIQERLNLPSNVSLTKIEPEEIDINLDKYSEKYVRLRSNLIVKTKDSYKLVGSIKLSPDSVKIIGANSVLSKIKFIPTEVKVIEDINSNMSGLINIKDTLGNLIKIEPKSVRYSFNVELSADKNFADLDIAINNVPENKEVLLIPPKAEISLKGGVEQLSKINPAEIKLFIDFKKLEDDTLGYFVPEIQLPVEANVININPPKFQYIIKMK